MAPTQSGLVALTPELSTYQFSLFLNQQTIGEHLRYER
jgi:hypothetical protein